MLFFLFLLLSPALPVYAVSIPLGAPVPQFSLTGIDGEKVSLSEYKGNIVVLIYWKTDQDYSLEALEDCRDFFNAYKGRGIQFIGLIADTEDVGKARKIIKDYGIDFPVLTDTGRYVYGMYGIRVYPTTLIVDRDGKHFRDIPGHSVTYRTKLEEYLRHMLGEKDDTELKVKEKSKSQLSAERNYNLALKFAEAGLINHAITSAESSIDSEPDVSGTHVLLGFLFLKIQENELAVKEFHKALELDPESKDAKTGLGMAYLTIGETDKAIDALTAAVMANPYPQMTYYELGRAYELQGEKNKALEMYKKSLDDVVKDSFFYQITS
jgi:tetratricopeptide (TPR) repeat protein